MCQTLCSGLHTHNLINPCPPCESCITIISIYTRGLTLKEGKSLAQVHRENTVGAQDSPTPKHMRSTFVLILRIRNYYIVITSHKLLYFLNYWYVSSCSFLGPLLSLHYFVFGNLKKTKHSLHSWKSNSFTALHFFHICQFFWIIYFWVNFDKIYSIKFLFYVYFICIELRKVV